jgi:elongation factor Ts
MEKAVEVILKKGLAKSAKRAGAVASEGEVAVALSADAKHGVIVEVNIQTDFAARNPDFKAFVQNVVDAAQKAKTGADLGQEPYPGGTGTIEDNRQALVGRLGENVTVRRWGRLAVDGPGKVHGYVHMGGKIGALLAVRTGADSAVQTPEFEKFIDDTAMQIAAMAPAYLTRTDVAADDKAKQVEIFEGQLREQDKAPPEKAWPKIIEGKVTKWMKEVCLLEQQSVLDGDKTIDQVRGEIATLAGCDVALTGFIRYERGEGLQAPQGPDFADEVAKMAGRE